MEILTSELCRKIIDTGVAYAKKKGLGCEISLLGTDERSTRFAGNRIIQQVDGDSLVMSVRVVAGGKQARVSTDHHVSSLGLRRLIDKAAAIAAFQDADPDMLALATPQALVSRSHDDAATAAMTASERGKHVSSVIAHALAARLTAAGFYETTRVVEALGNTEGVFVYDTSTEAQCSVTMTGKDSSGWAKADATKASAIDALALATQAAQTAIASANPRTVKPGRYTVILPPSAVLDLMSFFWGDFTGTSFVDQESCFHGQLGKKVLGDNITISDDVFHPLQWGATYDEEGMPKTTVSLVKNGVLEGLVLGRRSAAALKMKPTGHSLAQPSAIDDAPTNLVCAGGESSLEQMIASTKRGLLLTRVWYVRDLEDTTKLLTGMTRDGTFLIDKGQIAGGVKNLRFNQSLLEALKHVCELGPQVLASGEEGDPQVVPWMKIEGFNFSAGTKF